MLFVLTVYCIVCMVNIGDIGNSCDCCLGKIEQNL